MTGLQNVLESHVGEGSAPGVVALVARGEHVEVGVAGSADVEGTAAMARDSIFRIASLTKPIVAAAVMLLVDDDRIALEDPVGRWLPELASPSVVRTPSGPVDDVVPAARDVTVLDLLTSRAGWGFPSDFSLPAVQPLLTELKQGPPEPQSVPAPDEWAARLSRIPMLHQPGEAWLYDTCSDIQGVLVSRVSGLPLAEFLAERLFEPLGMADTGFAYRRASGTGSPPTTAGTPRAASSRQTLPAGSGPRHRPSRPAPAAWSRRSTTGMPSRGCCWPKGRPAGARCCHPRPYG